VTRLRTMMLEELQRRNYSQNTARAYIRVVRELAAHFRQPPYRLGPEHMRLFQAHLFRERKLNDRSYRKCADRTSVCAWAMLAGALPIRSIV